MFYYIHTYEYTHTHIYLIIIYLLFTQRLSETKTNWVTPSFLKLVENDITYIIFDDLILVTIMHYWHKKNKTSKKNTFSVSIYRDVFTSEFFSSVLYDLLVKKKPFELQYVSCA